MDGQREKERDMAMAEFVEPEGSAFAIDYKSPVWSGRYLLFPGKSFGSIRGLGLLVLASGLLLAERRAAMRSAQGLIGN